MKLPTGLTDAQLIERRKGIGGSDAHAILTGGEAWYDLWMDKTGRAKPKPIMGPWDVALRHVTEGLQMDWYEHVTGNPASLRGQVIISSKYPFLRCTLDGFDARENRVIQAKHLSHWLQNPVQWAIDHYSAQITHEMVVCGVRLGTLAILVGMAEPEHKKFELDPFYAEAYIDRARQFWGYVERDEAPPGGPAPMPPPIPLEDMRDVEMTGNNQWASDASEWLQNAKAAKAYETASKALKTSLASDVRRAWGHGVEITRNKAGALTVKALP